MEIVLNGEGRVVADGCSVLELLADLGIDGGRVAVELDGVIVRKGEWPAVRVKDGAKVEVVHFVGGG